MQDVASLGQIVHLLWGQTTLCQQPLDSQALLLDVPCPFGADLLEHLDIVRSIRVTCTLGRGVDTLRHACERLGRAGVALDERVQRLDGASDRGQAAACDTVGGCLFIHESHQSGFGTRAFICRRLGRSGGEVLYRWVRLDALV